MTKNSSKLVASITTQLTLMHMHSPINDKIIKKDGFKFLTVPFLMILYIHMISIAGADPGILKGGCTIRDTCIAIQDSSYIRIIHNIMYS